VSDDFDREEQAFRDAFVQELEGEGFRPLDPDQLKAAAPVRRLPRPWLKGLAAAAAVVLVVGGAGVVLPRLFLAGSAASGSVAAAPAEDRAGAAAGGVSGKDTSDESVPGPAPSGAYAESSDWVATAPSPLTARVGAAAAWLDGSFYVVGGREPETCPAGACPASSQAMVDGAAYDPAADAWVLLPDAPIVVADAAPAVVGSRLYYLGTADRVRAADSSQPAIGWSTWAAAPPPDRCTTPRPTCGPTCRPTPGPTPSSARRSGPTHDCWSSR